MALACVSLCVALVGLSELLLLLLFWVLRVVCTQGLCGPGWTEMAAAETWFKVMCH